MAVRCGPLTAERARELFEYRDGHLYRRMSVNGARAGTRVGSVNCSGYVNVMADRVLYLGHRVVWLVVHGSWPTLHLDHINGVRSDNRIENLRECTAAQNSAVARRRKIPKSGYRGVHQTSSNGLWAARFSYQGKRYYVGTFDTAELASASYWLESERVRGPFSPERQG